jgi:NADH:ubiquinone oxidoreductase subunit E
MFELLFTGLVEISTVGLMEVRAIEQGVQECPLNDHMSKLMLCVHEIQNVNLVWLTVIVF